MDDHQSGFINLQKFHFGTLLPQCGKSIHLYAPSAAILFFFVSFAAFISALLIGWIYNSVPVLARKIRTPHISNTSWIFYYLTIALKSLLDGLRYSVNPYDYNDLSFWLFIFSLILEGAISLTLCFALNHQRKYRCRPPSEVRKSISSAVSTDPLLVNFQQVRNHISSTDILYGILAMIYYICLALFLKIQNDAAEASFLGSFALQRIPVLFLVFIILFRHTPDASPSVLSKVYLGTAALLNVSGDIPLEIWTKIFGDSTCILGWISFTDIVNIMYLCSLELFFLFLRSEYLRNVENTIWEALNVEYQPFYETDDH